MSKRAKSQNRQNTRKSLNKSLNSNKSKVNKRKSRQKLKKSDIWKNIRLPSLNNLKNSPLNGSSRPNQVTIVSTPVGGNTPRNKRNRKAAQNYPSMLKNSSLDNSNRRNQVTIVSTPVEGNTPRNERNRNAVQNSPNMLKNSSLNHSSRQVGGKTLRSGRNGKAAIREKCIKNICKSSFKTDLLHKTSGNNVQTPTSKNNESNSSNNKDNNNSVILLDIDPKSKAIDEQNDSVILIDITSDCFSSQECKSQTDCGDKNLVPKKSCSNEVENSIIEIDDLETDVINLTSDNVINLTSDNEFALNESSDIICLNSPQPMKVPLSLVNKRKMETVVLDTPDLQKNKNGSPTSFERRAKVARTQITQTSTFDNKKLLPHFSLNDLRSASSQSHQKEHTETDFSAFTKRLNNLEQQHLELIGNKNPTSVNNYSNNNFYHPTVFPKQGLRLIVIDGSNVAMGHSQGKFFSCRGLKICIDYFVKRGHRVKAFVPQFRRQRKNSSCPELLESLAKQNLVVFTPSRMLNGRMVVPYDDRFIIQCAAESEGIIVSNDNYRDLLDENPKWRSTIEKRLLMWTWVDDMIMFPSDPLGRHGPTLDEFLRFP